MASDYQPISCINHERLEFAVIKRQWLNVEMVQGDWAGVQRLLPVDVYACGGVEWLEAQTESGKRLKLRLDAIKL